MAHLEKELSDAAVEDNKKLRLRLVRATFYDNMKSYMRFCSAAATSLTHLLILSARVWLSTDNLSNFVVDISGCWLLQKV